MMLPFIPQIFANKYYWYTIQMLFLAVQYILCYVKKFASMLKFVCIGRINQQHNDKHIQKLLIWLYYKITKIVILVITDEPCEYFHFC